HVLNDGPGAADLPLAPGAGALDEAAVDADCLAGHEVALNRGLVDRPADLLHHRLRHADRLALLAIAGLLHFLVTGLAHRLVSRRLPRPADRVPALLHDGLAHRPGDGIGLRAHLGATDRDLDRVPALPQHGLLHLAGDGVGDLLVGTLPDGHHLGRGLAL